MHPGFFKQLLLISQFELKRGFATRKGLLFTTTFAVVWILILLYPLRFAAGFLAMEKDFQQGLSFLDFLGLGSVQHWSIPECGVFWQLALILFPMLSISLAADQTCSDRERGTLRFILLRSSRDCLFFGRFVGVWFIQILLIGAAALSTLVLVFARDSSLLPLAFSSLFIISVNLSLSVLPFTAMMAALSVKVKTARQVTVWAILIWIFLAGIISILANYLPVLTLLNYLVPGYQLTEWAQLSGYETLQLAYIPILQTLVLLCLGRWLMSRQAL